MQPLITKTSRCAIGQADRSRGVPLSFAQRGLWLLEQLDPGASAYNVPFAVRLEGDLDRTALALALEQIAARHEALRTSVAVEDGEPVQLIAATAQAELPLTDISGVPAAERDDRARRLVDAWAHEPFELASGPLIRTRVIRLSHDVHIFVLVMHHIVCDGLSIHLFFDELASHYAGHSAGERPQVQYADYAAWQRGRERDEAEIEWWRQYLAGAPTTLALPTDNPRPPLRGSAGATHVFTLPRELADTVGSLARGLRMSPFMVMMSAYAVLVGRLCGSEDVLIGTPFSARSEPELESLIGFFVNTLPVRVDLSGQPTFAELLRRVRGSLLEVLAHQHVPFDTLVETLAPDRSPSHTPLVQTVFTFEPRPMAEPRLAGVTAQLLTLQPTSAKFDLDFMVVQKADGSGDLEVAINYSTELFEAATIGRLADRFHRLLAAAVGEPDTPVRSLPLLSDDERSAVLEQWSSTGAPRPTHALVHELFAQVAAATPCAPAVALGAASLTYAELDARADRLACHLQELGAAPDDVIGILLPRGIDLVTAVLGIMKAGAAYLPLDSNHPAGHIARVLGTAGSTIVLTDRRGSQRVAQDATAVCLDELSLDDGPLVTPRVQSRADNLAYVIFTSGSTGEPKGVGVPHRALANHAQVMRERFELRPADRVLQFANVGFDVAAEEIFPTWLAGGCVVLCADPPPPDALAATLAAGAVTVANLPSSYWQQWVATLDLDRPIPAPALRLLVIGSESVDAATLAAWCRRTTIPVLNAYGLTETTVTSLVHAVQGPPAGVTVPIGKPIAGVEAYVLDADLEPVAPGVSGELYLGGAGLARGYLARPDLTAERFVPNPFASEPGARLHRTGDRASWLPDGSLQVLGRLDDQLKVRGYRIEPAEVEAALCSHPEVTHAVVAADAAGHLVGYVVSRGGGGVPDGLRDQLAARLPTYLVPNALVALAALPLSASGKVDRKRLPAPAAAVATRAVPARTELEHRLVAIWRDVLGVEQVGIDDNFFDAGGSSFTLATVHARLCDLLGRRLPMVALYEYPTIAALSEHLSSDGEPRAAARAGAPPPVAERVESAAARAARLRARRTHVARKRLVTS